MSFLLFPDIFFCLILGGSSPLGPTINRGGLAQLGERLICIQEVSGSIPLFSTTAYAEIAP